jgi:hypothetical protein
VFERGSIAGVGGDAGAISVSEGSITVGNGSIGISLGCGLSFALVDLAHGGDGEGSGGVLERGSTGNSPVWVVGGVCVWVVSGISVWAVCVWGISDGSISLGLGCGLSLSLTLSDEVTAISVTTAIAISVSRSVGVSVGSRVDSVVCAISTVVSIRSVGSISVVGIRSSCVAVSGSVEERGISLSLGLSGHDGGTDGKSYDDLQVKE